MRLFYWVLGVCVALLVGVLFAPLLVEDPGYILIRFQGWTVETSVVVVVVGLILLWAVLRAVTWFMALPRKGMNTIKERRVKRHVEHSLAAISEGRWDRAEKALVKSARGSEHPALNYLAAARAATDTEHQRQYLELAESEGSDPFAVALTRAELALVHADFDTASALLVDLKDEYPRHPRVLRLCARTMVELGHWPALLDLIGELRRARAASERRIDQWEQQAARGALQQAADAEQLESLWRTLGKRMRQRTELVAAYAARAQALQRTDLALAALELALKRDWQLTLVTRYGELEGDASPQLQQAERWLQQHGESAELLLTLGRLARRAGLWGKATEYLRASLSAQATPAAWETLGRLYESEQCFEAARSCFSNALRCQRGEDTVAVPVPQTRSDDAPGNNERRSSAGLPVVD